MINRLFTAGILGIASRVYYPNWVSPLAEDGSNSDDALEDIRRPEFNFNIGIRAQSVALYATIRLLTDPLIVPYYRLWHQNTPMIAYRLWSQYHPYHPFIELSAMANTSAPADRTINDWQLSMREGLGMRQARPTQHPMLARASPLIPESMTTEMKDFPLPHLLTPPDQRPFELRIEHRLYTFSTTPVREDIQYGVYATRAIRKGDRITYQGGIYVPKGSVGSHSAKVNTLGGPESSTDYMDAAPLRHALPHFEPRTQAHLDGLLALPSWRWTYEPTLVTQGVRAHFETGAGFMVNDAGPGGRSNVSMVKSSKGKACKLKYLHATRDIDAGEQLLLMYFQLYGGGQEHRSVSLMPTAPDVLEWYFPADILRTHVHLTVKERNDMCLAENITLDDVADQRQPTYSELMAIPRWYTCFGVTRLIAPSYAHELEQRAATAKASVHPVLDPVIIAALNEKYNDAVKNVTGHRVDSK